MPALRAGTHQTMDHEGEMKEAEEVIAIMESLSTVINTDDEFHAIQQLAQNLRSLVHMCQLNQKEVQLYRRYHFPCSCGLFIVSWSLLALASTSL